MECDSCKKIFKSVSSLNYHKKNAIYCLKIQGNIEKTFNCKYCKKIFNSQKILNSHINKCEESYIIIELKKENEELKTKIMELETKLEIYEEGHDFIKTLAKEPKSVINNNTKILNISSFNLNKDKVKNILDLKFDENCILQGQKGVAHFAVNNLLKDDNGNLTYICTDPSRRIFKYKDNFGEIQKDVKAQKLTNMLLEGGLKEKNTQMSLDSFMNEDGTYDSENFILLQPKASEINFISKDNSVFVSELSTITTNI
jgi:cell division protein FtsB